MTFLAAALPAMGGTAAAGAAGAAGLSAGSLALASSGTLLSGSLFTGATAAVSGASILGSLSNGLNLASAGLSLFGGASNADAITQQMQMQARSLEMQSKDDELQAKQEELRGKQDANDITEAMIRTISANRLANAANGLDISFGTPQRAEDVTQDIAEKQTSTTRIDAQLRAISRRRQAQERIVERGNIISSGNSSANAARLQGLGAAGGSVGNMIVRRINRG